MRQSEKKSAKKSEKKWHKGGCHCSVVSFKVNAPVDLTITNCNCSMCDKTGYQHLIVDAEDFQLLTGADAITTYTFGTHTAKHTFCKHCGIKSFYHPRSHPEGISVNLRCVDQTGFENIIFEDFDGQNWEQNIEGLLEGDK